MTMPRVKMVVRRQGWLRRATTAAPEAFDTAYRNGLMAFHRTSAPPIRNGAHGDDAPLVGAVTLALDHVITEAALADWAHRRGDS